MLDDNGVTSTGERCGESLCYQDDTLIGIARVDHKINMMTLQPKRPDRARHWQEPFRHAPPIVRWG